MTKSEFAVRLLFWLLPWPISKALPKALRIYYFGPTGEPQVPWPPGPLPPPHWLPNPDYPLPPDWEPGMPAPPDWIPDPSNPYIPGPGYPPPATHPHPPGGCEQYCDDNYWEPFMGHETWLGYGWQCDCTDEAGFVLAVKTGTTWATGFRPAYFRMFFTGDATTLKLFIGLQQLAEPAYTSGQIVALVFPAGDIIELGGDSDLCIIGDKIIIQSIEFW